MQTRACLLKMSAVLQVTLPQIFMCALDVHFLSNCVYNFTKFRCAERPFGFMLLCYHSRMPQKICLCKLINNALPILVTDIGYIAGFDAFKFLYWFAVL